MSVTSTHGVSLTFRPQIDALTQHLAVMVGSGGRLSSRDLLSEIGEYMVGEVQDNFDHQRLFDGSPMPQSQAAIDRAGKTLIDRHRLYDSYVYQLTPEGVAVGSNLVYARIHHFGGETGRKGARFDMVARPVLGVGPEQDQHITSLIMEELRRLEPKGAA